MSYVYHSGPYVKWVAHAFAALFFIIGCLIIVWSVYGKGYYDTWKGTTAKVTGEVTTYGSRSGEKHSNSVGRISVPYEFTIGEKTYTGRRYSFKGDTLPELEDAKRRYTKGTKLTVFYDPKDPDVSAILHRTGYPPLWLGILVVCIGLVIGSITFVVVSFSNKRAENPPPLNRPRRPDLQSRKSKRRTGNKHKKKAVER